MTGLGIKVYTDEDVDVGLARSLRERGYDVISTRDAGNAHLSRDDHWQLAFAAAQGRAIFSHNIADFFVLDHVWKSSGLEHSGIIVSDRVALGQLVRRMTTHLETHSPDVQHNTVLYLSR